MGWYLGLKNINKNTLMRHGSPGQIYLIDLRTYLIDRSP